MQDFVIEAPRRERKANKRATNHERRRKHTVICRARTNSTVSSLTPTNQAERRFVARWEQLPYLSHQFQSAGCMKAKGGARYLGDRIPGAAGWRAPTVVTAASTPTSNGRTKTPLPRRRWPHRPPLRTHSVGQAGLIPRTLVHGTQRAAAVTQSETTVPAAATRTMTRDSRPPAEEPPAPRALSFAARTPLRTSLRAYRRALRLVP